MPPANDLGCDVAYPQALTDLVGGQTLTSMFANLSDARPLIQSGRLKAIAVADTNPLEEVPGAADLRADTRLTSLTWFAIAAPRATSRTMVEQYERRCRRHEVAICNRAPEGSFADACRKLAC